MNNEDGPEDDPKRSSGPGAPSADASPAEPAEVQYAQRGPGNRPPTSAEVVASKARSDRIERVGELLRQGYSKRAIARELGVDESTVRLDVKVWVQVNPSPGAAEVRAREGAKLDRLWRSLDYARVQVDAAIAVAAGAARKSVDEATGTPSPLWADKIEILSAAVNDLTKLSGRMVQVSERVAALHGADAPREVHIKAEAVGMAQHVTTVPFEDVVAVVEHNTGAPALPPVHPTEQ